MPLRRLTLAAGLWLSACVAVPEATMTRPSDGLSADGFSAAGLSTPTQERSRGNAALGGDILDLTFALETGRDLPVLTRFEGPVTVALTGDVPAGAADDLARLVGRLRAEAGIDIRVTGGDARITVQFVPRATLRAAVPNAACFVVPRVSSWDEYTAARRTGAMDWATLTTRDRAAIFAPGDTSPQEARDCLHEELAQALGPLNDLYRLEDSVFNDDNFHTVLTGFDMLVLRAIYAPEIASGMTKGQVATALPAVLARMNPGGGSASPAPGSETPRSWKAAIETALAPQGGDRARIAAAERAVSIAMAQGWSDARMAFSFFALARVTTTSDVGRAVRAYAQAREIYARLGAGLQVAHIDMQMAAFALSAGQPEAAARHADRAIPIVRAAQNMGLLATLLTIRAAAADGLGDGARAAALRAEAGPLATYGFGSPAAVRQRLGPVAALAARAGGG